MKSEANRDHSQHKKTSKSEDPGQDRTFGHVALDKEFRFGGINETDTWLSFNIEKERIG